MISYRKLRDFEEEINLLDNINDLDFVRETLLYLIDVVDVRQSVIWMQSDSDDVEYDEDQMGLFLVLLLIFTVLYIIRESSY